MGPLPETKEQSKKEKKKRAKKVLSAGNVSFLKFPCDNIHGLSSKSKNKGEYYANLLQHLTVEIRKEQPHLA